MLKSANQWFVRAARVLVAFVLCALTPDHVRAQPCTPEWSDQFEYAGISWEIRASAVFDDGTGPALYVAGAFKRAGGRLCNSIAKWDGRNFVPLGQGLYSNDLGTGQAAVYALASHDPDGPGPEPAALYAGGQISRAVQSDGTVILCRNLVKWNGTEWAPVPNSLQGRPISLFSVDDGFGPRLYVGGEFFGKVVFFDQTGENYPLPALGGQGIAGNFASFDDDGSGPNPARTYLTVNVENESASIWRMNGYQYEPLSVQPVNSFGQSTGTTALAAYDPDGSGPRPSLLHAGPGNGGEIQTWNGTSWSPLPFTLTSPAYIFEPLVSTMKVLDLGGGPKLYFGGFFETPAPMGQPASAYRHLLSWNGATLAPLGSGLKPEATQYDDGYLIDDLSFVYTLEATTVRGEPALFVGGSTFEQAGAALGDNALFWSGTQWVSQYPTEVHGLSTYNPHVVDFDGSGPLPPRLTSLGRTADYNGPDPVVQWNGSRWVPSGLPPLYSDPREGAVPNFIRYNDGMGDALYAYGSWDVPGQPLEGQLRLARFNGTSWEQLADDFGTYIGSGSFTAGIVHDIDGNGPEGPWLILASNCTLQGTVPNPNIIAWDGNFWRQLGTGFTGLPRSLLVFNEGTGERLYADGSRLDGTTWTLIATPSGGSITTQAAINLGSGTSMFIGGSFSAINGTPMAGIARWTGSGFVPVGSGAALGTLPPLIPGQTPTSALVSALAPFDDGSGPALWVAGRYSSIGGVTADGLAKWNGAAWAPVANGPNSLGDHVRAYAERMFVLDDDGTGPTPPAIYFTGFFDNAGGRFSQGIARYGCPLVVCRADFNNNGAVGVQDIFDFLTAYFTGSSAADINATGTVTVQDIFDYVTLYFVGC